MRSRPSVRREGTGYSIRFVGAQRALVDEALSWLAHRREGEPAVTLWAGCGRQRLEQLRDKTSSAERAVLSVDELHILHAVLLSINSMFASEEAYHTRLGFSAKTRSNSPMAW